MMRLVALGGLLLTSAGCVDHSLAPAGPAPPEPFSAGIELSDSQPGLDSGAIGNSFNFAHLRDLWVRVKVATMPHVAFEKVTLVNPRGEPIYEELNPFSSDPTVVTVPLTMMGLNNPSDARVTQTKPIPGGLALDYPIPVSGSVLQRYADDGQWTVTATVDGTTGVLSTSMAVTTAR